jgi:hypothetical protein
MLFRQLRREPDGVETGMQKFIDSNGGRIAARILGIGRHFDPEVLSLPGGSIIAVLLWAYANAMPALRRTLPHLKPATI